MNREDIKSYTNRKIKLTCVFGNGEPIFYSGKIIKLNPDSVILLDKFSNKVLITLDSIKKVENLEGS